jgi:thiosulfate reductase cytochrome b subunit
LPIVGERKFNDKNNQQIMAQETYVYKVFERFWHWSQAFLILFLAVTGFEIHGSFNLMGFESAVRWHNISLWALVILIVFAIFWHFTTGEWRQYIPTSKFIKAQIEYYITGIFRGAPHPTKKSVYNKFNPLQRLVYLGLKIFAIPVQVVTGFLYLYYKYPSGGEIQSIDMVNLRLIALIHTIGAFALVAFVIAHVYLTTTGKKPLEAMKAMITGWEDLEDDHDVANQSAMGAEDKKED